MGLGRALRWLPVLMLATSACECGLTLGGSLGPVAVGAEVGLSPRDTCAARRELPWCKTQVAVRYSSISVGPQFSVLRDEMTGDDILLRAEREGSTALEVTAIDQNGDSHALTEKLQARAMDELRFFSTCASWAPLIHLPTSTSTTVRPTLFGGGEVVYGTLTPAPYDVEGLTVRWNQSDARPRFGWFEELTITTPGVAGEGVLRSNRGTPNALRVQVWAPASIPRLSIEPAGPLRVGAAENKTVTAWATAATDAGVDQRFCEIAGTDWVVTASPSDVCRTQREAGAASHRFALAGVKPGVCVVTAASAALGLSANGSFEVQGPGSPDGGSPGSDGGTDGGSDGGADGG